MKRNKKKNRFINLAEQFAIQNEIVSSTMDCMLKYVGQDSDVQDRSDFEQIKKTTEQVSELNPVIDTVETGSTSMPRPKMTQKRSTTMNQTEKLEG